MGTTTTEYRTVPEVAKQMRSGTRPIYQAIRSGRLKAVAINERGDLRIADAWVREWIDRLGDRHA